MLLDIHPETKIIRSSLMHPLILNFSFWFFSSYLWPIQFVNIEISPKWKTTDFKHDFHIILQSFFFLIILFINDSLHICQLWYPVLYNARKTFWELHFFPNNYTSILNFSAYLLFFLWLINFFNPGLCSVTKFLSCFENYI